MMHRKVRIARTAAVVFAAAALVVFAGVVPASADVTSAKVTDPTQSEVIAGSYDSDGTPSGFKVTLKGQATTSCSAGWQTIKFTVSRSSPSWSQTFTVAASNAPASWSGSAPTSWDTQPLRNGVYTVRLDVVEKDTLALQCKGQNVSHSISAKVANPAEAPDWSSAPVAALDGSAKVTLRWKQNAEEDVLEYHIVRTGPDTGPDGAYIEPVSASNPGAGCSVSSNVYTCTQDGSDFPANYSGTYSYRILALRERPAYNSGEENQQECVKVSKPCVVSKGSAVQSATLVAPTPSPSPTGQPSTPAPGTIAPGTPSSKPNPGGNRSGAPRVLSFGSGGGSGGGGFYSGTYSEQLPYQPRTMILGGGSATSSPRAAGYQGEVVSETKPDYRTIMLPVAGGLLAFLSAAHVRRLLLQL